MKNKSEGTSKRDVTMDVMRGVAIFLMVQGNIAASIFPQPYPGWGQLYVAIGSFVPALFILLAGMMVVLTTEKKGYTLKHFLMRGAGLMISAALVLEMLVWGITPFVSADVLYLIGLSLPLAYLFQKLSAPLRWILTCSIFLATPFLQNLLGYAPEPTIITLTGDIVTKDFNGSTSILHHWLIDGWFPIFPWLGFAFLGVNMGIARWREKALVMYAQKDVVLWGVFVLFLGVFLWDIYGGPIYIRNGFSENIYPPTLAYIVTSIGEIILMFSLVDWKPLLRIYNPLKILGESSLFVYLAHFALIEFFPQLDSIPILFGIFIGSLVFLFALAFLLRKIREKYPRRSVLFRHILGI